MGKYSAVIEALSARIEGHIGTGKILESFKYVQGPLLEVEGEKDYPKVRLWIPELSQFVHPRLIGEAGMTLKLTLATSLKAGLVEWCQAVEKVLDAIETDHTTGQLDLGLNGTLKKPMEPQVRDNFATPNGLSLNAQITISVMPHPFTRGARRS